MTISFDWLKQYISISESPQRIAELLTASGLEVESVEEHQQIPGGLQGFVIGEVLTCERFTVKEKQLSLTTVDIGQDTPSQIVCGASNVDAGQKVIVATIGTTLFDKEGNPLFTISSKKTYGHLSEGMICAEDELGLGTSHDGILVLNTSLPNGTPATEYFNISSDFVFEIGLTPNRADAASHYGVARDLKALLKRPLALPKVENFSVDNTSNPVEVVVENTTACPRYSGITISNLKVSESPEWLKKRLKAIDINPINNIVDVTNFVLHELGQPLHAFDLAKVGKKVIVKTGLADKKFVTLDSKERILHQDDLMICNATEPMCIGGVFGGKESGVSDSTTSIFLESAYFSPDYIRKTSMRHGLKTDAAFRYERGTDPNITVFALKRAALLIKEVVGGEISSNIVDIYLEKIEDFEIELSYSRLNKLIGAEIPTAEINRILNDLDIVISESKGDNFKVKVPPYRVDVQREADILEEVLRIYGYNSFEEHPVKANFIAHTDTPSKHELKEKIADLLVSRGFSETITNSITNSKYSSAHDFLHSDWTVNILNYNSEDLDALRTNMIFSGLEVLKSNLNRRQRNLKLFEFGKTYRKKEGKYVEKERLAILLHGNEHHESWVGKEKELGFVNAYTVLNLILDRLGIEFKTSPLENKNGKFAYGLQIINSAGDGLGKMGVLNSAFAEQFEIEGNIYFIDLNWDRILKNYSSKIRFKELSKFPLVRRDLSIVLNSETSFEDVKALAHKTERDLLQDINVFDVYVGPNLGEGKKSYSVSFDLQAKDKTLDDRTIDSTMERLIKSYETELGAVIRR